ncbi:M61 family metallopeptidase [Mongoliitalea daihaiensis]|uniref:M61 family metallopeptidase n=1 Tax=Mongoliitalea daihaiensis TaxID=2782006 RepID=UPI001F3F068B|nr:M61 family peptidase [Mongoliitalea daihaiensis]UJP66616.1 M61 family peptidase [Mongoliitalea daihaiensis]
MHYLIQRRVISSQFIEIQLTLDVEKGKSLHFQLAAWRPGRYELANYAQNIRFFNASQESVCIPSKKISKDCWEVTPLESGQLLIHYEYFCSQMDAGGCWSDDEQLYLNFSNCTFYVPERTNESIRLAIELPADYRIACALPQEGTSFIANDYQELMDSPLMASASIQEFSYLIGEKSFKVWIQGAIYFAIEDFLQVLKEFSQTQIESFGDFPAQTYHFLYQILPYRHYHGVEHRFSTVITFGPDKSLEDPQQMQELIGVSSHELYHFWNVCRIRPKGINPYDLSKEVYLDEGIALEGITTYMGDLMLLKAGYFSLEQYFHELKRQIQKESETFGWRHQSILESSRDLWLDGYKPGIPHKKVNIYNRGSLISFCLDICLLEQDSSLQAFMRVLWEKFGKTGKGYDWKEFLKILRHCGKASNDLEEIIQELILGKNNILPSIQRALREIGVELTESYQVSPLRHQAGIIVDSSNTIVNIHPDSPGSHVCMLKDQLMGWELDETTKKMVVNLNRHGRKLTIEILLEENLYFPHWAMTVNATTPLRESWKQIN